MQWRQFYFFLLFSALFFCHRSTELFFSSEQLIVQNNSAMESGRRVPWDVFTKTWCNYTGRLLTLGKIMRNELLMKTLPGAARWIYVLFYSPNPPILEVEGENWWKTGRGGEVSGGRKRTNPLDFNKELSQQIVWPYINHAEAMGDLPTGPEHSSSPLGLPQDSQYKTSQLDPVLPKQTLSLCWPCPP